MRLTGHIIFRSTLIALLLFAQQAAFAHEAGHLRDHYQEETHGKTFHSDLCDFHGTFGDLMSIVSAVPPALPLAHNAIEQYAVTSVILAPRDSVVPASRGPPVGIFLIS